MGIKEIRERIKLARSWGNNHEDIEIDGIPSGCATAFRNNHDPRVVWYIAHYEKDGEIGSVHSSDKPYEPNAELLLKRYSEAIK